MNLEHLILKLFLVDTESYLKYSKYLDKKHNNIYNKLYHTIARLKESESKSHTEEELVLKFHTLYPVLNSAEAAAFESVVAELKTISVEPSQASELFAELRKRKIAGDIAIKAVEIASGEGSLSDLSALLEDEKVDADAEAHEFVCNDIVEISNALKTEPPFRFRLKTLNSILGGLRRRTFGFIFARPETGKTHLLVSEATFIARQVPNCVLWINNEEDGIALITRAYQAALGKTTSEVFKNAEQSREQYQSEIGQRLRIYDRPEATIRDIETLVRSVRPDVVFIDQLDKVHGVKAERHDLVQKQLYQWAREMAKKYNCAVVGICQAGGTAEGKKYLDMNDVDSSHTAKQGEADWLFGLGRSDRMGDEDKRFISVCKNKLPENGLMDSARRHAKIPIRAVPEIQIYEDVM